MSPALSRGVRKALRSLLQLAAAGGLTWIVDLIAHGLSPAVSGLLVAAWGTLVAFLHNFLESNGSVPTILPTPGLVTTGPATNLVTSTVGTVDTVTTGTTQVVGDVLNTAGQAVGAVTGTVGTLLGGGDVEDPSKGL